MGSFYYFMGNIKNSTQKGWSGLFNKSVTNLTDNISKLKKVEDCPQVYALFENSNLQHDKVFFTLTRHSNPHGRCCKAIIPDKANESSLMSFYVKIMTKNNLPKVAGFQLLLSSQKTYHKDKLSQFNTNGITLKIYVEKPGYALYRVKLHEEFQLEEDPKINCRNYDSPNDYEKVREVLKMLNL